jgi:hypothetical protein
MAENRKVDLDYSRPLDVHRWSDHPEVNSFVDDIYKRHFRGRKVNIKKKHLKVVLLDLYVAWSEDPNLKIAFSRNVNDYQPKTRYNSLHISRLTIDVVDRLIEAGLVEQAIGFKDWETEVGRRSRIWATEALRKMFAEARFGALDIADHSEKETVILRDVERNDIEYEDTDATRQMRGVLQAYNQLLHQTFVDIPSLDFPIITLNEEANNKQRVLHVSQADKFVRRIFNRGSFEMGGRLYGGWWQNCPEEWRERIFLDDQPTNELDYSGLHIVMLYARRELNYYKDFGGDPYTIPQPAFLQSAEQTRDYVKSLLLVAINARSDKQAFQAFRDDSPVGSLAKTLKDVQLAELLERVRAKHPKIAGDIASDAGISLQNQDALITDYVVQRFTAQGIPILTVHDSYIVQIRHETLLGEMMQDAFAEIMKVKGIRVKPAFEMSDHGFRTSEGMEITWRRSSADQTLKSQPARTKGYLHRLEQFQEWRQNQSR